MSWKSFSGPMHRILFDFMFDKGTHGITAYDAANALGVNVRRVSNAIIKLVEDQVVVSRGLRLTSCGDWANAWAIDYHAVGHDPVLSPSLDETNRSTEDGVAKLRLTWSQNEVYKPIRNAGYRGITSRQIADAINWPLNRVSPRVAELRRIGLVEPLPRQQFDKLTCAWVNVWHLSWRAA